MNILLINHYAGSPEMGMEYRPYYFAREWKKLGHNVLIVSASFHHLRSNQPIGNGYMEIEGVDYLILKTPKYRGNGIGRIMNILFFVIRLMCRSKNISLNFKPDVVIASSTYPSDIYPARKIAKHSNAKLVFEVHDLWPLSPMLLGGYAKNHPFIRVLQHGENYACKYTDHLISMLPGTKPHFIQHGLKEEKWAYVPNGIDPALYERSTSLDEQTGLLIKEIKSRYKYLAIYAGSHGIANSLDTILDAAMYNGLEDLAILLVGQGPEKERLQNKAKEMGVKNIFFCDPVPKQSMPDLLGHADMLLIAWNKSPLYKFGISPNKIFDYMMAMKPVVHATDAINDIVKEAGCGISVQPENPEELGQAIQAIMQLRDADRQEMGRLGNEYVLKNHTYSCLSNEFLKYIS